MRFQGVSTRQDALIVLRIGCAKNSRPEFQKKKLPLIMEISMAASFHMQIHGACMKSVFGLRMKKPKFSRE